MNTLERNPIADKENDALLWQVLDRYYFEPFRHKEICNEGSTRKTLELFIRGECPSHCTYCYLNRFGDKLYPRECQDEETILNNIDKILEFYVRQKFVCSIEMFSGECIVEGLMPKIWDKMYNCFSKLDMEYRPNSILHPENCDFVEYPEMIDMVQEYIDKFGRLGIRMGFSASVDGKYMDDNRTRVRSKDFYPNLFNFLMKNDYGCHPMVAAHGIEKWIQNYDWWKSDEVPPHISDRLMMLEVRNDDWTKEKIQQYIKFINHVADYEYKNIHHCDNESFMERVFCFDKYPRKGYDNIVLPYRAENRYPGLSCSGQSAMTLRVGDLGIALCHRTSYDKFMGGFFTLGEDGYINGVRAHNVPAYISMLAWDQSCAPYCTDCSFNQTCIGPCLGANYEATNSPFMIHPGVCNLMKAKTTFLVMKYLEMGLFDLGKQKHPDSESWSYWDRMISKFEKGMDGFEERISDRIGNWRVRAEGGNFPEV
ncbi:MAG TPA: hypothetical protein DCW90_21080 [Lachnospiraceae bacterium]|nr:hypothetical protein [Lachnospiraceae bacterium]